MRRNVWPTAGLIGVLGFLLASSPGQGQLFRGRIGAAQTDDRPAIDGVFPPAATVGETTEWTISGRNLKTLERLVVSGAGVEAVEVKPKSETSALVSIRVAPGAEAGFREVRAVGPGGLSNLVVCRIDTLKPVVEAEPNDDPAQANEVAVGSAVAALLKPQDVDHFRVRGRAGRRITIEVEARRFGTMIVPVVTVFSPTGASLAQGRESPGIDRDCRMAFTFPSDGDYVVQVRDNTYGGNNTAAYRLRLDETPYATALFPLGGPRGQSIAVTASGGNLAEPRTKAVTLPDDPGAKLDPGPFDGPGGPALAPMTLAVGDGPEVMEGPGATPLPIGATANGRIERPGEVDRYTVAVKKGKAVQFRVRAAELGSWLDSVVAVRDGGGATLAEDDDAGANTNNGGPFFFQNNETPSDSRLDFEPKADGELTVEVADRFGRGGPEYGYRLEVGPAHPDFTISLLLGNTNRTPFGVVPNLSAPGASGSFNLKPGSTTPVNFLIVPQGSPGTIEVRAEGLPPGVSAAPTTIKINGPASARSNVNRPPSGGALVLKVSPDAAGALGELRVVAIARLKGGGTLRRVASMSIPIGVNPNPSPFGGVQNINRSVASLPVKVLGEPRPVGPLPPVALALKGIVVSGALLQGGGIDLTLQLDPTTLKAGDFQVEAETDAPGLITQTFLPESPTSTTPDRPAGTVVRVLASADAPPGVPMVHLKLLPRGAEPIVRDVPIVVRAPLELHPNPGPIPLGPGQPASFRVGLRREPGFEGPVDLQLESLPDGAKVVGPTTVPADRDGLDVTLEWAGDAKPPADPSLIRVVGLARMPRGLVRVESTTRPMLTVQGVEK